MGIFINEYDEEFSLQENAQFHILPKFKTLMNRYPELGKYQTQLKNVEEMFAKLGKDSPIGDLNKFVMLLVRFESTLSEWSSIALVFVPISGWLMIPMARAISWLWDTGAFELAKNNTNKMINELEKIKSQTKDTKVKKHCDEQIKKLKDTLNELSKDKKASFKMESTNYFAMMEADDQETEEEIDKVADAASDDDEDEKDSDEVTKEFFEMLDSISEGDGCGECPDDDITDDDEVSVDVEVDEFYAEESCKSSKKKSKKKAIKEDDAEEGEDDDEDPVEEGAFTDEFYDSDAEAAAAIRNNVTDEFFATLAAIKDEQ